ncbi:MAG: hypothetical protein DRI57_03305 [Deltaproteobacteria bacterium]|nr:MAG: hypothetical protein DRI57_03305 [Deltaproteobacteria bacterium]
MEYMEESGSLNRRVSYLLIYETRREKVMNKRNNDKKYVLIVFGWLVLLGNLITILQFIFSGDFEKFGTAGWWISVLFVVLLWVAGSVLFSLSDDQTQRRLALLIFGFFYVGIAVMIYVYWGYAQMTLSAPGWEKFAGYLILFVIAAAIGFICLICESTNLTKEKVKREYEKRKVDDDSISPYTFLVYIFDSAKKYIVHQEEDAYHKICPYDLMKYATYAFGIADLIFWVFLIHKYVFSEKAFEPQIFIGELIIMIIGAGLFFGLHRFQQTSFTPDQLIDIWRKK